jgi:hypothetical protein
MLLFSRASSRFCDRQDTADLRYKNSPRQTVHVRRVSRCRFSSLKNRLTVFTFWLVLVRVDSSLMVHPERDYDVVVCVHTSDSLFRCLDSYLQTDMGL